MVTRRGTRETKPAAPSAPKFPYTTKPSSLRRLLKEIPKKPRPDKFDKTLLHSWGFKDNNDYTMLRVLKAVNLLNANSEPTETYSKFMNINDGARALGPEIRRVYSPMFQASHTPYKESTENLQNMFNIHSGGGERTLEHQIQTFKALCENAAFDPIPGAPSSASPSQLGQVDLGPTLSGGANQPNIHINLHIHLPENKTRRDYENIIEDIGRHIFGRVIGSADGA